MRFTNSGKKNGDSNDRCMAITIKTGLRCQKDASRGAPFCYIHRNHTGAVFDSNNPSVQNTQQSNSQQSSQQITTSQNSRISTNSGPTGQPYGGVFYSFSDKLSGLNTFGGNEFKSKSYSEGLNLSNVGILRDVHSRFLQDVLSSRACAQK